MGSPEEMLGSLSLRLTLPVTTPQYGSFLRERGSVVSGAPLLLTETAAIAPLGARFRTEK